MDEKHVREYLLETVLLEKKYSMGKSLIYNIKLFSITILVVLGAAFLSGVLNRYSNTASRIIFILLVISIPVNIILSLKKFKNDFINWKPTEIKTEHNNFKPLYYAGSGTVGIGFFSRLFGHLSEETQIYIYLLFFTIMLFLSTYALTITAYRFYLLKKYCPNLMKYRLPKSTK